MAGASRCGDLKHAADVNWHVQDHAIAVPCATGWREHARQDLSPAAIDIDPFQFAVGKEADRATVG